MFYISHQYSYNFMAHSNKPTFSYNNFKIKLIFSRHRTNTINSNKTSKPNKVFPIDHVKEKFEEPLHKNHVNESWVYNHQTVSVINYHPRIESCRPQTNYSNALQAIASTRVSPLRLLVKVLI